MKEHLIKALSLVFVFIKVHETGLVVVTGASTGIGRHAVEFLANTTKVLNIMKLSPFTNRSITIFDQRGDIPLLLLLLKFTVLVGVRKDSDANAIVNLNNPALIPLIVDVADHASTERAGNQFLELFSHFFIMPLRIMIPFS